MLTETERSGQLPQITLKLRPTEMFFFFLPFNPGSIHSIPEHPGPQHKSNAYF